jgi:hypothetical protein
MPTSTATTVLFDIADQEAHDRVCETLERTGRRAPSESDGAEALDLLHQQGGLADLQPRTPALASVPNQRACPGCHGHAVRLIRKTVSHAPGTPSTEVLVCQDCEQRWERRLSSAR